MSEWTPESTEYLEGYLGQVRALARGAGEDGDEIASGLREHVVEKTESAAGPVVTLDVLRRALAEVGTPDEVLGDAARWGAASGGGARAEDGGGPHSSSTHASTPSPSEPRQRRGIARALGCGCAAAGAVGVLAAAALLALMFYMQLASFQDVQAATAQSRAVQMLRTVAAAERKWREDGVRDNDGDGVPDYATLMELIEAKAVPEEYGQGAHGGYVLNIVVSNSSETAIWKPMGSGKKEPGFLCSARPLEGLGASLKAFVITHEEVVRYEGAGGVGGEPYVPELAPGGALEAHSANTKGAIEAVQAIARSEQEFLQRARLDSDGDDKPDYGDLDALDRETGDISTFGKHDVEGYAFHIELTPSSEPGGPSFVCRAIPVDDSVSTETIAIGPDSVMRFLTKDEIKREQETQYVSWRGPGPNSSAEPQSRP